MIAALLQLLHQAGRPPVAGRPKPCGAAAEVLLDGGVRRGTDALIALALGATAVGIGRPVLWGLACDGEAGVGRVLDLLTAEIEQAMALAGVASVGELSPSLVA